MLAPPQPPVRLAIQSGAEPRTPKTSTTPAMMMLELVPIDLSPIQNMDNKLVAIVLP